MTDKMREFVDEVKQLCKDFSDQRDRPYMGDVHAALEGLYEQWQAAQSVPVVGEPLTCDECGAATDDPWHSSESGSRHFHRCDACHTAALESQRVPVVGEPDCYDAGLLGYFGGGNVEWWQDYIRSELERAHEFYVSQWPVVQAPIVSSVVGYLAGGTLMRRKIQGYECKPLVVQPTHSIPAAELASLREQVETHALELRAYEATVQNLEQRIREIEAQSVPVVGEVVALQAHLEKIRGKAHGGAMLGHDAAYKACLEIDAAVSRIFQEMRNGKITTPITAAELATLREKAAEADELRKDADRYRWLRDSPDSPIINIGYATDKMVDAAIAQGKGE